MSTSPVRNEITSPFAAVRPLPRTAAGVSDTQQVGPSQPDSVEIGPSGIPLPELPPQPSTEAMEASSLTMAQRVAAGGFLGLSLLAAFGCWAGTGPAPGPVPPPPSSISAAVDASTSTAPETRAPVSLLSDDSAEGRSVIGPVAAAPTVDAASASRGLRQFDHLELHDGLRIDVVRSTRTEVVPPAPQVPAPTGEIATPPGSPDRKGTPPATTITRPGELSPFGVDLGDGLFFDLNGNLTINPLRVGKEYSEITVDPAGLFNSTTVTRTGDTVRIDPSGLFNSTVITQEGDRTVIDGPGGFNQTTLTQRGAQTTVSPFGVQGYVNPTTVVETGSGLSYNPPGLFNRTEITHQGNQTRITVPGWGNDVTVMKTGDTTRVVHAGWADDIVITKHGDTTVIDPFGLGNSIVITRSGDTIRVDPPGLGNSVIITVK